MPVIDLEQGGHKQLACNGDGTKIGERSWDKWPVGERQYGKAEMMAIAWARNDDSVCESAKHCS